MHIVFLYPVSIRVLIYKAYNLYIKTRINHVRLLMNIGHLTGIRIEWKSLQYIYAKLTPLNRSKLGL